MFLRTTFVIQFVLNTAVFNSNADGGTTQRISERKCTEYQEIYRQILRNPLPHISKEPIVRGLVCPTIKQGLIVGGRDAEPGEFPHMASVEFRSKAESYSCGGTLISENYVLTAAHCFYDHRTMERAGQDYPWRHFSVRGEWVEDEESIFGIELDASLRARIKRDLSIRPACLPPSGKDIVGDRVIATGWGFNNSATGTLTSILQAVNLTVHDNDDVCDVEWKNKSPGFANIFPDGFQETMLCAGEEGKDTCGGDSGGPLTVRPLTELPCLDFVVGITSTGSRQCGNGLPAAYTRVDKYIDWIEEHVWKDVN